MRITYYQKDDNSEIKVVRVSTAKKLLKQQGGYAWTEIYERDGTMCDSVEVKIKGNNTNIKMNHHL